MVVGIVAEYNPFHYGHLYQIEYAKNVLGADTVVVAMSGSFTQRGEIAICDKYARSQMAIKNGADIVFEIPTLFSTASAKEFASCGCEVLNKTGVVDTLLFGVENGTSADFIKTARLVMSLEKNDEVQNTIKSLVAEGNSYALSRWLAIKDHIDESYISSSNNILGLEYTKYLQEHSINMSIACLKRQGGTYNETSLTGKYSSASAIRSSLNKHKTTGYKSLPTDSVKILSKSTQTFSDDVSLLLHNALISSSDFSDIADCNKDISNKIIKNIDAFTTFSDFAYLLKSKNLAYSRISRVLCHILLNITEEQFEIGQKLDYVPYLRMLGFSENGQKLLKEIKAKASVPVISKVTEANILLNDSAKKIFDIDVHAADIMRIIATNKDGCPHVTEYTRKFNDGII